MPRDQIALLAQAQQQGGGIADLIGLVIYLVIIVLGIAGMWKTFAKAGQPGWGAIIPFYNFYLMCKVAGWSGWWVLLLFIPPVNLIIAIFVGIDIAKNFGKGTGFGLGLAFLWVIFFPILGFSDARYIGKKA
jgi:Family of unknown function (DUF5684)